MKQVRKVKIQQRRTSHREIACKSVQLSQMVSPFRYAKRGKLLTDITTKTDRNLHNIGKIRRLI